MYCVDHCCHFCLVTTSCLTLCDLMDCSPSGSSVHGTSQARILEWVAIPFSRGSYWLRHWTHVLHWQVDSLPLCHPGSLDCIYLQRNEFYRLLSYLSINKNQEIIKVVVGRSDYIKSKHISMPGEHQVKKWLQHKWQNVNILSIKRYFINQWEKDKYPQIKISKNIKCKKKQNVPRSIWKNV